MQRAWLADPRGSSQAGEGWPGAAAQGHGGGAHTAAGEGDEDTEVGTSSSFGQELQGSLTSNI